MLPASRQPPEICEALDCGPSTARRIRMNLPNRLTLARLGFAALFVLCFSVAFPYCFTAAFALFVVATFTDWLDGEIARRQNLVTDFGKLMDPLADKILTAAAFICLVAHEAIPAWAVVLIVSREFLITGLRSLAASNGIVMAADTLGKHKTSWQMGTILYFLLLLAWKEFALPAWFENAWWAGTHIFVPIMVALSTWSGLAYLFKNRDLIDGR
jgi:CDP-diacylglycerol--glycerol-3-phosphate 3-phosphatidyltransferase